MTPFCGHEGTWHVTCCRFSLVCWCCWTVDGAERCSGGVQWCCSHRPGPRSWGWEGCSPAHSPSGCRTLEVCGPGNGCQVAASSVTKWQQLFFAVRFKYFIISWFLVGIWVTLSGYATAATRASTTHSYQCAQCFGVPKHHSYHCTQYFWVPKHNSYQCAQYFLGCPNTIPTSVHSIFGVPKHHSYQCAQYFWGAQTPFLPVCTVFLGCPNTIPTSVHSIFGVPKHNSYQCAQYFWVPKHHSYQRAQYFGVPKHHSYQCAQYFGVPKHHSYQCAQYFGVPKHHSYQCAQYLCVPKHHSYQCAQYFCVLKQWCGCQCLEFLMCTQKNSMRVQHWVQHTLKVWLWEKNTFMSRGVKTCVSGTPGPMLNWPSHIPTQVLFILLYIHLICSSYHMRMMMMSWCLMSSDVIWHIRDKLWPMPKHGSIKSTYVRCMRV